MTASWSKCLACLVAAVTCSNTYTLAGGLDETISDGLILRQKLLDNKTLTYVRVSLDRFDVRVITPLAPFVDSKLSAMSATSLSEFLGDFFSEITYVVTTPAQ